MCSRLATLLLVMLSVHAQTSGRQRQSAAPAELSGRTLLLQDRVGRSSMERLDAQPRQTEKALESAASAKKSADEARQSAERARRAAEAVEKAERESTTGPTGTAPFQAQGGNGDPCKRKDPPPRCKNED